MDVIATKVADVISMSAIHTAMLQYQSHLL